MVIHLVGTYLLQKLFKAAILGLIVQELISTLTQVKLLLPILKELSVEQEVRFKSITQILQLVAPMRT
jgi:hypothetical protein